MNKYSFYLLVDGKWEFNGTLVGQSRRQLIKDLKLDRNRVWKIRKVSF